MNTWGFAGILENLVSSLSEIIVCMKWLLAFNINNFLQKTYYKKVRTQINDLLNIWNRFNNRHSSGYVFLNQSNYQMCP